MAIIETWRKAQRPHFIRAFDAWSRRPMMGRMSTPDLNLLLALDVLLDEMSVARAARRMRLSASAMSRTLARLREATGDPLLVRAGRSLMPTPRALELRDQVSPLVRDAETVLRPTHAIDPSTLERTFTLRTSEGFAETFGPDLIARVATEAPRVRLRFLQKPDKDSAPLREGAIDLETGVVDKTTGPEVRAHALFRDRLVGVVRAGHPLSLVRVTLARYTSNPHVDARRGSDKGPIDDALEALGRARHIATIVSGFATAISLARATDLIASVPDKHTVGLRFDLHTFALPFATPDFAVSLLWHPRLDADPAHRWLRGCVRDTCAGA